MDAIAAEPVLNTRPDEFALKIFSFVGSTLHCARQYKPDVAVCGLQPDVWESDMSQFIERYETMYTITASIDQALQYLRDMTSAKMPSLVPVVDHFKTIRRGMSDADIAAYAADLHRLRESYRNPGGPDLTEVD
jgi:hypothetical protein